MDNGCNEILFKKRLFFFQGLLRQDPCAMLMIDNSDSARNRQDVGR